MDLREETKQILRIYSKSPNKKLGQNFLINEKVVESIIEESNVSKDDTIIEIGPGIGTLTGGLIKRAGKVIAIELDLNMVQVLKDRFKNIDNLSIINEDILSINLKEIIKKEKNTVKVIANLPYYITTPIIMRLLEEKLNISSITIMIQREVADRLLAVPGDRLSGRITYTVAYFSKVTKIQDVPKEDFLPSPQVDSTVVKLEVINNNLLTLEEESNLFNLIKFSFAQRRKTLVNSLINSNSYFKKESVLLALKKLEISDKVRAENLTLEQFIELAKILNKGV